MVHLFTCHQCGETKTHESPSTTGYALDKDENIICFDCCALNDAKELKELPVGKRLHLYLNTTTKEITNWPGTFRLTVKTIKTIQTYSGSPRHQTAYAVHPFQT